MAPWMIAVLIVLIIAIIALFWFADRAAKGGGKAAKSATPNEEKPSKNAANAAITPDQIKAIYEDKDFDNQKPHECHLTEKERDTVAQAAEKANEIVADETSEQRKIPTPETARSPRTSSSRMREYYENRWGQKFNAHSQIYGTIKEEEQGSMQISQEDVKKLLVLKDLFDKKS